MEEVKINGVKSLDLEAIRVSVSSSSTSRRKAALHALDETLKNDTGKLHTWILTIISRLMRS